MFVLVPYRTKTMSDIFFVGQNFRHFCPTKDFVQSSFLSYITYYKCINTKHIGKNLIFCKIFCRTKLFIGHNFRHFQKISSLLFDFFLSDKILKPKTGKNPKNLLHYRKFLLNQHSICNAILSKIHLYSTLLFLPFFSGWECLIDWYKKTSFLLHLFILRQSTKLIGWYIIE